VPYCAAFCSGFALHGCHSAIAFSLLQVGCQEFTLMIVLMCAAVAGQQMQAVHAYHSSICRVFAGVCAGLLKLACVDCGDGTVTPTALLQSTAM
jgi:hypothetical protein